MAFYTNDYDVYVLLGDPASEPIWYWQRWAQVMPDLDELLLATRGAASVRSIQFLPNRAGTVKFGRINWKESDQQKWTHRSPINLETSAIWSFCNMELWAPGPKQSERENLSPDVFLSISNQAQFGKAASFNPVIVIAVVSHLAQLQSNSVARVIRKMAELSNAKFVAHQRRPWGHTALGGRGFTNAINDLQVTGLFKPGSRQERSLGLELFAGAWEEVPSALGPPLARRGPALG
jgi:hypothetical protein